MVCVMCIFYEWWDECCWGRIKWWNIISYSAFHSCLHCSLQCAPLNSPATTRANLSVFVLFSMKLFSSSLPGNGKFHNWTNRNGSDGMPMKWLTSSSIYQFCCATYYWWRRMCHTETDKWTDTATNCRDAEIFPRTLV